MLEKGLIVKINREIFFVSVDTIIYDCQVRGKLRKKDLSLLVGDYVMIDKQKKVITELLPRKNFLHRPPVSNIDLALIITSIKSPDLNLTLLDKLISVVTINKIEPVIILTKLDLLNKKELKELKILFNYYKGIGLKVFTNNDLNDIKKYLAKKVATVCGQTGAGKSTFINKLDRNLTLPTGEISKSLNRGKHTTRVVQLLPVLNFYIIDTPGFSSLSLANYSKAEIKNSFLEFRNSSCKFHNCQHQNEIGCYIKEKVEEGKILKSRYNNYLAFIKEE